MKTMYKLKMFNASKTLIMHFTKEEIANKQAEQGIKAGLLIEITAETLFEEKDIISGETMKQYM